MTRPCDGPDSQVEIADERRKAAPSLQRTLTGALARGLAPASYTTTTRDMTACYGSNHVRIVVAAGLWRLRQTKGETS